MLKYIREAIQLYREAEDLKRAEKRLEQSNLDYNMLEKLIKGSNKEITIKFANGTTLTVNDKGNEVGYKSFRDKYAQLHS